jgi:hypothetical protein
VVDEVVVPVPVVVVGVVPVVFVGVVGVVEVVVDPEVVVEVAGGAGEVPTMGGAVDVVGGAVGGGAVGSVGLVGSVVGGALVVVVVVVVVVVDEDDVDVDVEVQVSVSLNTLRSRPPTGTAPLLTSAASRSAWLVAPVGTGTSGKVTTVPVRLVAVIVHVSAEAPGTADRPVATAAARTAVKRRLRVRMRITALQLLQPT